VAVRNLARLLAPATACEREPQEAAGEVTRRIAVSAEWAGESTFEHRFDRLRIAQTWRRLMLRLPDPDGLRRFLAYATWLRSETGSGIDATLAASRALGPTAGSLVAGLYRQYLDREPDEDGLALCLSRVTGLRESGVSDEAIAGALAAKLRGSEEYRVVNEQLVEGAYEDAVARPPSEEEKEIALIRVDVLKRRGVQSRTIREVIAEGIRSRPEAIAAAT
jgi:hypothetical protein